MSTTYQESTPYEQPPYDDKFSAEPPPPKRTGGGWLPACLLGCLVMCLLGAGLCAGVGWYVAKNAKQIASNMAREMIVGVVSESELDEEEKQAIIAQVDRVVDKYQSGEISTEDLGRIMEELAESPLVGTIMIYSIEAKYVTPSGLSDEEKKQARLTLQRVLRGVYDETITLEELEPLLDPMTIQTRDGNRQLKDTVTDQELRDFLAGCKQKADEAEVPDEPFEVKISEEFRRAVDSALGE
ncbi:MAG: hypothetical protein H8E44_27415 [Planctomycetes bacterium]|nr:hypothetical protein [Planctomycetota bacterium]